MKIRYKEGMPRWILCLSYSTASKYLLCTFIYLHHTLLISTHYIYTLGCDLVTNPAHCSKIL